MLLDAPSRALGGRRRADFIGTCDGRTVIASLIAQMQGGAYACATAICTRAGSRAPDPDGDSSRQQYVPRTPADIVYAMRESLMLRPRTIEERERSVVGPALSVRLCANPTLLERGAARWILKGRTTVLPRVA